jgi:tetratricopeptide (TPR) repeat protein
MHLLLCVYEADYSLFTRFMFERGYFSLAETLLQASQRMCPDVEDATSASLLFSLAGVRNECNRVSEAKEIMDRVMSIQEKILDPSDPTLGNSYYSAAIIYMELDQQRESYRFLQKAFDVRRLAADTNKAQTAFTHGNMGLHYLRFGELEKSAFHLETAVNLCLCACGRQSDHYAQYGLAPIRHILHGTDLLLRTLYNLGNVRIAQGDHESAFRLHGESLEIRLEVTPRHDKTGYSLHKIASLCEGQGRFEEAL